MRSCHSTKSQQSPYVVQTLGNHSVFKASDRGEVKCECYGSNQHSEPVQHPVFLPFPLFFSSSIVIVQNELLGRLEGQFLTVEQKHKASLEEQATALKKAQAELVSLRAELEVSLVPVVLCSPFRSPVYHAILQVF